MKYIVPLIVASFMLAIATAMLEGGPLTLPFLIGYLLGIVVPVVVYTGILTLVLAGIYRVYTGKDTPNLIVAMWGIWVLVAAVNFFGNYQNIKDRQADQAYLIADHSIDWEQDRKLRQQQQTEDVSGRPSAALTLQTRFMRETRQLDAELARNVAMVSIPPLFDPEFLEDKSRFPASADQLDDYGQLFQNHKKRRKEMLSQMKADIEQLDLPQNEILQAIQEFNGTYEIDGALSEKYFDIVIEVSRQGIAYLDFLNRAHYEVSNGRAMFETDTETDKYQAFLQTFKRLSEQEVSTQRELADSRKKRMARLRELSR
ncbi:MAG: hypothetical protein OEN52_00525 [Gammaproteobacteria bacterium]|nr:hypothetical protein [Gammaproteobacteria bacterium]MDH3559426.1 hypothetical protein [Gammaproteobacteria bacterium]